MSSFGYSREAARLVTPFHARICRTTANRIARSTVSQLADEPKVATGRSWPGRAVRNSERTRVHRAATHLFVVSEREQCLRPVWGWRCERRQSCRLIEGDSTAVRPTWQKAGRREKEAALKQFAIERLPIVPSRVGAERRDRVGNLVSVASGSWFERPFLLSEGGGCRYLPPALNLLSRWSPRCGEVAHATVWAHAASARRPSGWPRCGRHRVPG